MGLKFELDDYYEKQLNNYIETMESITQNKVEIIDILSDLIIKFINSIEPDNYISHATTGSENPFESTADVIGAVVSPPHQPAPSPKKDSGCGGGPVKPLHLIDGL